MNQLPRKLFTIFIALMASIVLAAPFISTKVYADPAVPTNPTPNSSSFDPTKWYNISAPAFSWTATMPAAEVDNYWVYFGSDSNPSVGSYSNIQNSTSLPTNVINLNGKSTGKYYLNIFVESSTGVKSSPVNLFTYQYDPTIPNFTGPTKPTPVSVTNGKPKWDLPRPYDEGFTLKNYRFVFVKAGVSPQIVELGVNPLVASYTHDVSLSNGVWFAVVEAVDQANNSATSLQGCVNVGGSNINDCSATVAPTPTPTNTPGGSSTPTSDTNTTSAASSPTSSSNPTTTSTSTSGKLGDFNNDGKIDLKDFNTLLFNWNKKSSQGDLTGDGTVDLKDFNQFIFKWGK